MVVYGTYVASQSIMFERSCLLPNIKALYIYLYLPVITEENTQKPRPFLCVFLFTKIYATMGMINAYLQIILLDFVHSITF